MEEIDKYPYYMAPCVAAYRKADPDSKEAEYLRRLIVANIGDRFAVRQIIGIDPPEYSSFYPDMDKATPDTMETIDSFLDKFGAKYPASGYMADYETRSDKDSETLGKDEKIKADDKKGRKTEKTQDLAEDINFLIKNHHYREALQIIERRNLNNTEKNVYFADQIRFLKKLIIIESYKKQTKG